MKYFGKLGESNFFAYAMKCIDDCNQKSIIVLSGHKIIITLVLKNSNVDQQFHIKIPSSIEFLTANGHNTLGLDRTALCWFESSKKIKHLKRDGLVVKAVCAMEMDGFCEITSSGDGNLQLSVFEENDMKRVNQPVRSFDLSWHENSKESRHQEVHTLLHVLPQSRTKNLLEKLYGAPITNDVFLFSIDNTLMGLRYEPSDPSNYELVCVKIFAATVKSIWLSPEIGLLVLLESGVLEVLYVNKSTGLLIQRQSFFCADILAADLVEDDIFVCLDGDIFYQLSFHYSATEGDLLCTTKDVEFSGGLAFAYIKRERMCFCITDNNLFYTMKIKRNNEDDPDVLNMSQSDFMEVDETFLREAGNALTELRRANAIHKQTTEQKKRDSETFQTLNVFRNRTVYARFCRATIEVRPWLPTTTDLERFTTYVPPASYRSESLSHVVIRLEVDPCVADVLYNGAWSLQFSMQMSQSKNVNYLFRVEKLNENFRTFCLPFDHGDLLLLPQFEVEFVAFVKNSGDSLKCSIPVAVSPLSAASLFTKETTAFSNVLKNRSIDEIVTHISSRWSLKTHEQKITRYTITLPLIHSLDSVVSTKQLYFFGHLIVLGFDPSTRQLHIQSSHPGAIYYLKKLVYDRIFDAIDDDLTYTLPFRKHSELKAIELGLRTTKDDNVQAVLKKMRDIAAYFEFN